MPPLLMAAIGAVSAARAVNDRHREDERNQEIDRSEEHSHRRRHVPDEHEAGLDHDEADRELQDTQLSWTVRGVWGRHARVLMEARTGFGKIAISPTARPLGRASPAGRGSHK